MNDEQVAKCLSELGNITRLKIFKLLVKAGENGLSVGEIQEVLGVPASTLSHHISKLVSADLLRQDRDGRTLHCIANYEVLENVINELRENCCLGI